MVLWVAKRASVSWEMPDRKCLRFDVQVVLSSGGLLGRALRIGARTARFVEGGAPCLSWYRRIGRVCGYWCLG